MQEAAHTRIRRLAIVDASMIDGLSQGAKCWIRGQLTYRVVLMLSKGVTASSDSVIPAPNPAITVLGPDILPSSSCNRVLYVSKATNPAGSRQSTSQISSHVRATTLIPAFKEFPIIRVVHPAYQALPKGGQPSFCPSGNRRLSWVRVLATTECYRQGAV